MVSQQTATNGFVGTDEDAVWTLDPAALALDASRWRRGILPDAFCLELGRRLLLAELEFSEWILRRVEKVDLQRDRSVSRRSTFELHVRDDAPVFVGSEQRRLRLVPLTVMRRQTLVNLDLRDESEEPLTVPGIRLTQQFDQSILLAAAEVACPGAARNPVVIAFVRDAIAGSLEIVRDAYRRFDDPTSSGWPAGLRENPLFGAVANRLRHNFTLYVFLVDKRPHRLIHMSLEEQTAWHYQRPELSQVDEENNIWDYRPGKPKIVSLSRVWGALGYSAIRFRFQVPGAENAASYHFEIAVPPGVQIVRATLLAGRPNELEPRASVDCIVGHSPTVGLHALEVPNGSLCRVQVDLRAPYRGWLSTMTTAALLIAGALAILANRWSPASPHHESTGYIDEITNLVLILSEH